LSRYALPYGNCFIRFRTEVSPDEQENQMSELDIHKPDARQFAPATERNREPILAVLRRVLPASGLILEIASGTGEHASFFAPQLAPRYWLPSDANADALASIRAWQQLTSSKFLLSPIALEISPRDWPQTVRESETFLSVDAPLTAIANINMIHISPWSATLGLMAGAGALLPPDGILYLYGPYQRDGKHTAPSNEAFDEMLKARDPNWGVRHLEDVIAAADCCGLRCQEAIAMPANNLSVIFKREA
jgi:Protein of unknown function (DUF938)